MSQASTAVERLADRLDIHDCLVRFCRAMDRFDRELALSCFHAGAVCDYGPYVGDAAGLLAWAEQLRGSLVATHHHISNHSCEIEGDTAHAETYLLYSQRRADGTNWEAHGRYVDRLERRNGAWRITMRYCLIETAGTVSRTEMPFAGIADLHANGEPAHDRSDPSYRRPLVNSRAAREIAG